MHLLSPLPSQRQLFVWDLLRLLYERVNNHDALADQKSVKRTTDPGSSAWAQLEQPASERPGMRQPKTWTVFHKQLYKARVVGKYIHRPGFNSRQDFWMEVLDSVRHKHMLANALTRDKALIEGVKSFNHA